MAASFAPGIAALALAQGFLRVGSIPPRTEAQRREAPGQGGLRTPPPNAIPVSGLIPEAKPPRPTPATLRASCRRCENPGNRLLAAGAVEKVTSAPEANRPFPRPATGAAGRRRPGAAPTPGGLPPHRFSASLPEPRREAARRDHHHQLMDREAEPEGPCQPGPLALPRPAVASASGMKLVLLSLSFRQPSVLIAPGPGRPTAVTVALGRVRGLVSRMPP
nr:translation initiation factor IF-2-like [Desmodus rotundus]